MSRRRLRILLALVTLFAGLLSIVVMADHTDRIIVGDPAAYRMRVAAILEGGLPYRDVPLEHLPVMLVPMFGAWFLGGAASQSAYVVVFAGLMSVTLAVAAHVMDSLGESLDSPRAGLRWLATALPLVPLVIFRNDPIAVLLFAVATLLFATGRRGWVYWAVAGALAKIWPATISLATWRSARFKSLLVAVSGAIALGWTLLPGFTVARAAVGIHAETLFGALTGLWRTLSGNPSGVVVTTAAYLPVSNWVVIGNALVGVSIVLFGLRALVRTAEIRSQLAAVGVVVAGVILASQLFSLQYVLWLTPFLAIGRRGRLVGLGVLMGILTVVLGFVWQEARFDEAWFYGLFSLRNAMVFLAALWLASEARASTS